MPLDHFRRHNPLHRRDDTLAGRESADLTFPERRRQEDVAFSVRRQPVNERDVRHQRAHRANLFATEWIGDPRKAWVTFERTSRPGACEREWQAIGPRRQPLVQHEQRLVLDLDLAAVDRLLEHPVGRRGRIILTDKGHQQPLDKALSDKRRLAPHEAGARDREAWSAAAEAAHECVPDRHRATLRVGEMQGHARPHVRAQRLLEGQHLVGARMHAHGGGKHLPYLFAAQGQGHLGGDHGSLNTVLAVSYIRARRASGFKGMAATWARLSACRTTGKSVPHITLPLPRELRN